MPGQPGPAPPCCPFAVPCLSGGLGLSFGKGFRGIFKTATRDGIRSGIVCFLGRRPSGNCTWRVTGAVCGFLTFSPVRFHAEGAPSSLTLTLPRRLQGHFGGGGQKCFPKERLASFCRLAEEVGVGGARTPARSWAPRSILGPPLSRPHPPVALFLLLRNISAPCLSTSTMLRYLGVWETRQPGAAAVEAPKGELPSALGGLQIQPLQAPRRWSTGLEDRNCAMNSHLSHTDSWKQD